MNVTKWVQLGIGLFASSIVAGCAGDGSAATSTAPQQAVSADSLGGFQAEKGKLLYSAVKQGNLVQILEMEPGVDAVLEIGALDKKPIAGELGQRSLSDLYRSLEGTEAPAALRQADERRATVLANQSANPDVLGEQRGLGPEFYNDGEQQWFRGTFCNGADVCVQAWDWAFTGSLINVNNETFYGMVGSEGTVNANLWLEYWYSKSQTWPWACGDCGSWWQEFDRVLVVPGHWVSINVPGTWSLQGHLDGAGGGTQISLSARR